MPTYEAEIIDGVGSSDALIVLDAILAEGMSSDDALAIQIIWNSGILTEGATIADVISPQITWDSILTEAISVDDTMPVYTLVSRLLQDSLISWDTLKWGWHKSIADEMAIVETIEKILGIPVNEWLTLTDVQTNNWSGVEAVSSNLYIIDIPKVIQAYDDLISDGIDVADAVHCSLVLMITDILTSIDTVANIGVFQHTATDSFTLADIISRAFPKTLSDSFAATDVSLIDFLAYLQLTDTITITEDTTPGLTISQTISDALSALDTVTLQQFLQELITDGLSLEVLVEMDGEVWECWVLNTSSFHPSVYSGYDYNSFAIDYQTSIVYGCKSDGIYVLDGDDDDGTAFKTGIILPDTRFGTANNKRFRKAWLGVSGDNVLLKAETESGWHTFCVDDAEVSLSRDLKGRSWKFSVENFDSLDMIELIPVILSRR